MRSIVLLAALFATIASVYGGLHSSPSWQVFPGQDGKQGLVLLDPTHRYQPPRAVDPPNDVKFYLYTRSNRNNPAQMMVGDLMGAPYDGALDTKFIAHGYTGSGFDSWMIDMKDSFLDDGNVNVVCVDWQGPASGPLYNVARDNVDVVGQYVGEMYQYLNSQGGSTGRTHCIGHSLGSHVCGFSGKSVNGLSRITGMDPALPLFDIDNPAGRLSTGDANYVDIIHTCGGWLGFGASLGHSDFFPNGGEAIQPGCGLDVTGACSHGRSYEFFIESIKSSAFRAHECSSWSNFQSGACDGNPVAVMGNPSPSNTRGDYYLATGDSPPYALG